MRKSRPDTALVFAGGDPPPATVARAAARATPW